MEASMRLPFDMDQFSPEEQSTIKRLYLRVVGAYSVVALVLVVMVTVKSPFVPIDLEKLLGSGNAMAAEQLSLKVCAARDAKMLMTIEDAGEDRTAPAEMVADAFLTMLKARELCSTGRVREALTVYDSIPLTHMQAAK
jgi:hypothetical protein